MVVQAGREFVANFLLQSSKCYDYTWGSLCLDPDLSLSVFESRRVSLSNYVSHAVGLVIGKESLSRAFWEL